MTDMTAAHARVAKLGREDHIETEALPADRGIIAWFKSDIGLRSLGQFSLVRRPKDGYGLVILPDGRIPRDAEASALLTEINQLPRA